MSDATAPIRFYFDFSSPYGYFAAEVIDTLAGEYGRRVDWCPMLLGAVFKKNGMQPLVDIPMKGDYSRHDMFRSARYLGLPFSGLPTPFPFASVAAARAVYWLKDRDESAARDLAKAIYRASFVDGLDMSQPEGVLDRAADLGLDRDAVAAGIQDQAVKDRLRDGVEEAIAAGAFGSPFFIVDGEPFWGADRLDQLRRWLQTGGF